MTMCVSALVPNGKPRTKVIARTCVDLR